MVRETSAAAYQEIEQRGLLSKARWEVYKAVYFHGPCTSGEAYQFIPHGHRGALSQSRARFTELRDMGVLKEAGERECRVSGHRCIVWDVTSKLPDKLQRRPSLAKQRRAVVEAARTYILHQTTEGYWALRRAVDTLVEAEKGETNDNNR
jgi:hypothetical protein